MTESSSVDAWGQGEAAGRSERALGNEGHVELLGVMAIFIISIVVIILSGCIHVKTF